MLKKIKKMHKNLLQRINVEIKERIGDTAYKSSNLKKYMSSNPLRRYFVNRFLTNIMETVEKCEAKNVIEIGCGEGFIVKGLSSNYNFNINACDVDKQVVKFAALLNPDVQFWAADINSLPLKEKQYDLVICCEVLEHLQNPNVALREIKRISKKYCIISVPYEPYFCAMNLLSGKNIGSFGNDPDHVQRWAKRGFKKMLAEELEIISLKSSLPWLIALCRVKI